MPGNIQLYILAGQNGSEKALKEAVREVFEERAREGRPVVIWQNGKSDPRIRARNHG